MVATGLAAQNNRINARARAFAKDLDRWMVLYARKKFGREVQKAEKFAKAASHKDVLALRDLILRHTLPIMGGSFQRQTGEKITPDLFRAIEEKEVNVTSIRGWQKRLIVKADGIISQLELDTRETIRRALLEANRLDPRPSAAQVARVIRLAIDGRATNVGGLITGAIEPSLEAPARAYLIARTELLQAENTGTFGGMEIAGVKFIEWLAFQSPIFERRHDRMHGERVPLGEYFTLPSGARMRYPGDPSGPVGELANCRCSFRAVRTKT